MGLSDKGIVLARRKRLAELLAEGRSQAESGEILKGEGFPADRRTLWKDVCSFELTSPAADFWRSEQLIELSELKAQLESPLIRLKDKVDLTLAIIDREIRLLGTESAKKSVNVNIDGKLTPEYMEIAKLMVDVDPADRVKALDFIKSLVRPVELEADCFPPEQV
jgi:hypothetical protein